MIIDLKNIDYYYLTNNNEKRKAHMENEFKNYNLIEVNPNPLFDPNFSKHKNPCKSASSGFLKMLDIASSKMGNVFKPFVMLEDDAKKKNNYPDRIEIPNDCDIFYLGHSKWGLKNCNHSLIDAMFITKNDKIVKLVTMLATHSIMVCSLKGLMYMQKCMMSVYYENQPWDKPLASTMHLLNVYTTREELMFQYGAVGGRQKYTHNIIFSKEKSLTNAREIPDFIYEIGNNYPLIN